MSENVPDDEDTHSCCDPAAIRIRAGLPYLLVGLHRLHGSPAARCATPVALLVGLVAFWALVMLWWLGLLAIYLVHLFKTDQVP